MGKLALLPTLNSNLNSANPSSRRTDAAPENGSTWLREPDSTPVEVWEWGGRMLGVVRARMGRPDDVPRGHLTRFFPLILVHTTT